MVYVLNFKIVVCWRRFAWLRFCLQIFYKFKVIFFHHRNFIAAFRCFFFNICKNFFFFFKCFILGFFKIIFEYFTMKKELFLIILQFLWLILSLGFFTLWKNRVKSVQFLFHFRKFFELSNSHFRRVEFFLDFIYFLVIHFHCSLNIYLVLLIFRIKILIEMAHENKFLIFTIRCFQFLSSTRWFRIRFQNVLRFLIFISFSFCWSLIISLLFMHNSIFFKY